jgi:membrane associated rhomboid family serine protease
MRIRMLRDFNVWPYFWMAILVWVGLGVTRPPGMSPFSIGAALGAVTALVLLVIGIIQAIKRRRTPR